MPRNRPDPLKCQDVFYWADPTLRRYCLTGDGACSTNDKGVNPIVSDLANELGANMAKNLELSLADFVAKYMTANKYVTAEEKWEGSLLDY
jgi:hypothetical protein